MRQHLGDHLVDPDLGRHGLGRGPMITGQQHRAQSEPRIAATACGGGGLDGVGDRDHALGSTAPADHHRRPAPVLLGRVRVPELVDDPQPSASNSSTRPTTTDSSDRELDP